MKTLFLFSALIFSGFYLSSNSVSNTIGESGIAKVEHVETTSFKVYGNCGMCKRRIENSLKDFDGVLRSSWDVDSKMLTLTFNPHVTSLEAIHKQIASVGHDTELAKADDEVYENLHGCCKYERTEKEKE